MKKNWRKLASALLAAVVLLCVTGCKESKQGLDPQVFGETHTDFPGVEVRIADMYDEDGDTRLEVNWINNTRHVVTYGAAYVIERLVDGQWVDCAKADDLAFFSIGYELKAGQDQTKIYNLTDSFDISQSGTYRFKTDCYVYVDSEKSEKCELWAEFAVGNVKCPDDSKEAGTALEYRAQYIRTNGYTDGAEYPRVCIIRSTEELNGYYKDNKDTFDLERKDAVYSDTTIGFLDACDQYDASFFEKSFLVFVLLEEGSGSIRHEVAGVEQTGAKQLSVSVNTITPEVGTCDMAQWHIILELSRDVEVAADSDVLIYLDGALSWNGGVVEHISYAGAEFTKPPEATLLHGDGSAPVMLGGYSWTWDNSDGTSCTVQADHLHPLFCKDLLEPVYVTGDYVKLDFEDAPDTIEIKCWPDTAWNSNDVPSEAVNSYDAAFDVKPGGCIYEITATWKDDGTLHHGTASYFAYIIAGDEHTHQIAQEAQTVDDPISGYCGNIQTTLHIGDKAYTFMYDESVTLTDILVNLDYKEEMVCNCLPEYTVDTEFGTGYGIDLSEGYARCAKGQTALTQEQINQISKIIEWVKKEKPGA